MWWTGRLETNSKQSTSSESILHLPVTGPRVVGFLVFEVHSIIKTQMESFLQPLGLPLLHHNFHGLTPIAHLFLSDLFVSLWKYFVFCVSRDMCAALHSCVLAVPELYLCHLIPLWTLFFPPSFPSLCSWPAPLPNITPSRFPLIFSLIAPRTDCLVLISFLLSPGTWSWRLWTLSPTLIKIQLVGQQLSQSIYFSVHV